MCISVGLAKLKQSKSPFWKGVGKEALKHCWSEYEIGAMFTGDNLATPIKITNVYTF